MRKIKNILSALLLFGVTACSNNQQRFKRDVPAAALLSKHGHHSQFDAMQILTDSLKLNSIANGFDSLEIRIWMREKMQDTSQVFIIKNSGGLWTANLLSFFPVYEHNPVPRVVGVNKKNIQLSPKCGWYAFVDSLVKFNILTLPDYREQKEYEVYGGLIIVEVATEVKYRFICSGDPWANKNFQSARNLISILSLIQHQFEFKFVMHFN